MSCDGEPSLNYLRAPTGVDANTCRRSQAREAYLAFWAGNLVCVLFFHVTAFIGSRFLARVLVNNVTSAVITSTSYLICFCASDSSRTVYIRIRPTLRPGTGSPHDQREAHKDARYSQRKGRPFHHTQSCFLRASGVKVLVVYRTELVVAHLITPSFTSKCPSKLITCNFGERSPKICRGAVAGGKAMPACTHSRVQMRS